MDSPVNLHQRLKWIRDRQRELRVAIEYEQRKVTEVLESNMNPDVIAESIWKHDIELEDAYRREGIATTAMRSAQLEDTMYKTVFMHLEDEGDANYVDEDVQKKLTTIMKKIRDTSSDIMKASADVRQLEAEVDDLQMKAADSAAERNYLMARILAREEKKNREKQDAVLVEKLKTLQIKSDKALRIVKINNQILPLLISYSGLKWSKDPELLDIVLECGCPLEEQLKKMEEEE